MAAIQVLIMLSQASLAAAPLLTVDRQMQLSSLTGKICRAAPRLFPKKLATQQFVVSFRHRIYKHQKFYCTWQTILDFWSVVCNQRKAENQTKCQNGKIYTYIYTKGVAC